MVAVPSFQGLVKESGRPGQRCALRDVLGWLIACVWPSAWAQVVGSEICGVESDAHPKP